jgi:D-alanyl-D-alanine carboxypeptidase/D-alanyl-D-alanine-endopeptidase (penicillin-binding protein 4)
MRRVMLAWGAVALLAAAAAAAVLPSAAGAQSPSAEARLVAALNSGMRALGGASGALVVDLSTGQSLYADAAATPRLPASVEKLYTTSTALLRFGAAARLTTALYGSGWRGGRGVWWGTLYLKGGGDPTFGSAAFDQAAYGTGATVQQLVANFIRRQQITGVRARVVGDESYFDSLRGTPATGYATDLPDVEGELSALAYDRGFADFAGTIPQASPALYAAQQFVAALRAAHVRVPPKAPILTGRTPASALWLAGVQSPPMSTLVRLTNTPSDNYLAEMLLKDLGARFGGAGTTAAGVAVVRAELATQFGITPQFDDGSGLSRSDHTSPEQVVTVLEQMYANAPFFDSLAVGGETGTLQHEMVGTQAQGNCHGKTGTLHDVASLAGYCRARDGHELAFAFLANRLANPDYAHYIEGNRMAVALANYDG